MNYTKGPWKTVKTSNKGLIVQAGEDVLFRDGFSVLFENEFNAKLIAAAPELLDALKSIKQYLMSEGKDVSDAANNAINKAEGRTK
jgi:hypothetical protein